MTPETYLDNVLTTALENATRIVQSQSNYRVTANLDEVDTLAFDIDKATAQTRVVWRVIPHDAPTQAFNLPTTLDFEVDRTIDGLAMKVTDMRVVSRAGCDIEIAEVPTIVSGEDYTDAESAGHAIDLVNYVNHQIAIADDLWASASAMANL